MQGQLTEAQKTVLRDVVKDQVVYDLGAGSCNLSRELLKLEARKVIAIDRQLPNGVDPVAYEDGNGVKRLVKPLLSQAYFHELDPIESGVAFVSWPQLYVKELVRVVEKAPTLVYLGCNTNLTACGPAEFWEHVSDREVLHHEPDFRNTLLVYGKTVVDRELVLEELAGLDRSRVYYFENWYG